jgi:hypothetical protein
VNRVTTLLLPIAAALVVAACHESPPSNQRHRPVRLPQQAIQEARVTGPAFLATAHPFVNDPVPGAKDWQLAVMPIEGSDHRFAYRVPFEWNIDSLGRASNGNEQVTVRASLTPLADNDTSLAEYLAQLSAGSPIAVRTTPNGWTVYTVERNVSVAPSDPNAEQRTFHTAVVDLGERIAKLDVTYDEGLRWRFGDLAHTILGTIDVQRNDS